MDEPLEIVFHNLEHSAAVEAAIRERFAKLEKRYDRLTHCRVSVEALHRQHRTGNLFEVHIDVLVPGAELAVSKQPQKAKERYADPDVYTSIKDAFAAAERQLKRFKRQKREDLQPQAPNAGPGGGASTRRRAGATCSPARVPCCISTATR